MQLSHAEAAVISAEKITDYLLNDAHPEGRSKAAFFRRFGFRPEEPHVMVAALLRLAHETEMTESAFAFGLKYAGIGSLICPDGRQVSVRSVWVLREGRPPPYFVTAYPV